MPADEKCTLPLIGGPFDGECLVFSKGLLTNKVPIYYKDKFHVYKLNLKKSKYFTKLSYEFTGEVLDFDQVNKYKCKEEND